MLVCAPTGAGKTNIAMIAVLREVAANRDAATGWVDKGVFKIVYVAPMKALAAEVTANFGKRLAPLGLAVRELTGDMQLTKKELSETQMIVTTPEKWDVITRKGGDVAVAALVRLLIIDEVHLLNDERGPVIETLVARTLRQVEASQSMIRIVGLSATLPNYKDVAAFLRVAPATGLHHFGPQFRPVPLETEFVGVSAPGMAARANLMNEICYNKVGVWGGNRVGLWGGFAGMYMVRRGGGAAIQPLCSPCSMRRLEKRQNAFHPPRPRTKTTTRQHRQTRNKTGRRRAAARQAGHGLRPLAQGDRQDGARARRARGAQRRHRAAARRRRPAVRPRAARRAQVSRLCWRLALCVL